MNTSGTILRRWWAINALLLCLTTSPTSTLAASSPSVRAYLPLLLGAPYTKPLAGIQNGGFEEGLTSWNLGPYVTIGTVFPSGITPHSGHTALTFDSQPAQSIMASQVVSLPPTVSYLVYWRWVSAPGFSSDDYFIINIKDNNGFVNSAAIDPLDLPDIGWTRHVVPIRAYAGQTVTLMIFVSTFRNLPSPVYMDDLTLYANLPEFSPERIQ